MADEGSGPPSRQPPSTFLALKKVINRSDLGVVEVSI